MAKITPVYAARQSNRRLSFNCCDYRSS